MPCRRLVALCVAWSAVAAADPAPRDVPLAEAFGAVGAAPTYQVAVAQQREAEAVVDAAGAWPATTLTAATTSQTAHLDLVAGLPLPIFGTLAANRAVARGDLAVAIAEVRASDLHLARDVAAAWFSLARAQAHADAAKHSADREADLVRITSERFAAGDASHADVVLASAAAKRLAARAVAAAGEVAVASIDLATTLGWDPGPPLRAAGGLPAVPDRAPAGGEHPEAAVAARHIEAQRARVTETSRARWPRLALDVEAALGDPTLPGPDLRLGLTAELPLFGRGASAVRAAEARLATARIESTTTSTKLGAALARARSRFAAATALSASLATEVLPAQLEAADLARAAYREGQTGLVVMLEAERALADAENEAIDARAEAALAYVELAWASGATP